MRSYLSMFVVCVFVSAWSQPVTFAELPRTESTNQAILDHLDALHEEVKALRGEVGQLRQAVKEIHRSTITVPSAPSSPQNSEPIDVALGDGPSLGNANATVGIVEFTDYECPFCQRFHTQSFGKIKETYLDSGKVRYFLRNFPLGFHAQAKPAALAAYCTGEQGQYWEMSHELFMNQRKLGVELYNDLADTLGVHETEFHACLENPGNLQRIEADLTYGKSIGVRGTPKFFIGRIQDGKLVSTKQISGAQPFAAFQRVLDSLLQ